MVYLPTGDISYVTHWSYVHINRILLVFVKSSSNTKFMLLHIIRFLNDESRLNSMIPMIRKSIRVSVITVRFAFQALYRNTSRIRSYSFCFILCVILFFLIRSKKKCQPTIIENNLTLKFSFTLSKIIYNHTNI